MRLLKNIDDWERWKEFNFDGDDRASKPLEFPCFAKTEPLNWNYQSVESAYYYKSDISRMLNEITSL